MSERSLKMVATVHEQGLYMILDIILNHSGNVFGYEPDRYWTQEPASGCWFLDPRWDGNRYRVSGFHDRTGTPSIPFTSVDLHAHTSA
jgi:glycosidase